jgi:excisionase family DNA binding protein
MVGMDIHELMTTAEVAEMLRMTPAWVRDACRRGELPYVRLGRQYRFIRQEILDEISKQAT